jgi:hypothetical protein
MCSFRCSSRCSQILSLSILRNAWATHEAILKACSLEGAAKMLRRSALQAKRANLCSNGLPTYRSLRP